MPGCRPIVADVATDGVEEAIAAALGEHDQALDLLVNNAGSIRKLRGLAATTAADLEALFRVHCVGPLRCVRAALPWLRRSARATVVDVTSRFGSIGRTAAGEFRGIYSYQIAKAAQNMLSVCLDRRNAGPKGSGSSPSTPAGCAPRWAPPTPTPSPPSPPAASPTGSTGWTGTRPAAATT